MTLLLKSGNLGPVRKLHVESRRLRREPVKEVNPELFQNICLNPSARLMKTLPRIMNLFLFIFKCWAEKSEISFRRIYSSKSEILLTCNCEKDEFFHVRYFTQFDHR